MPSPEQNSSESESGTKSDSLKNAKKVPAAKDSADDKKENEEESPSLKSSAKSWLSRFFFAILTSSPPHKKLRKRELPPESPQTTEEESEIKLETNFKKKSGLPAYSKENTPPGVVLADEERSVGEWSPKASDENPSKPLLKNKDSKLLSETNGTTVIDVNSEIGLSNEKTSSSEGSEIDKPIRLRELFEAQLTENVTIEFATKPRCQYSEVSFSRTQTIYVLPNTRQRVHRKIIRSRHDAWRRYGALKIIHELGGWTYTLQNRVKHFHKIEKGTTLPPAPNQPPILTEEEFYKRPIITMPANHRDTKSRRIKNNRKKQI